MEGDAQHIHKCIQTLGKAYFSYLASKFPVMCASDEFHFMPRAEEACGFYERLDSMDEGSINDCIERLKAYSRDIDFLRKDPVFRKIGRKGNHRLSPDTLEDYIDLLLLQSSMSALLIEFEKNRAWMHNPLLYLKIGFIGIDHALHKPASTAREAIERARERLEALPGLFAQAVRNLRRVPEPYHRGALEMVEDCRGYLGEIAAAYTEHNSLIEAAGRAADALTTLRTYLKDTHPSIENLSAPDALLERTLRDHFQVSRDISEVLRIARAQWDENLRLLREIEGQIGSGNSWLELYSSYRPGELHKRETLELYREENRRLREYFKSQGFSGSGVDAPLRILQTPRYLQSVRGSASFSAAFSSDPREESLFYITTYLSDAADRGRLRDRLHREYRFLTAHETFPGHHLLDHTRRNIANPVRRQIESPLFYEGWATYAESLLLEIGYVKGPLERLVFHKRNLWRAARCLADVGLTAGLMDIGESQRLLESSGFSAQEAATQIKRFRLNPGYQLCYSLGSHEILNLRKSCDTLLTNGSFHRLLLESGELPFSLIRLKLKHLTLGDGADSGPHNDRGLHRRTYRA